jgi:pimeloyl-ACP methyl ester carboxylesterase
MRTTRNGLHVMNALMQPSETGRGAAAVRDRQPTSRLPAAAARFLRPAAVVAAAGLLATALAPLTASASASRPSAAWRLGVPPVPVPRWRSCDGGFQCATARVPLDYRDPRGAAISIAMMRHRATSPAHRIGSLFFNSGGPSEQIEGFPAEYAGFPPAVRARFDILTFDPRGFGYSTAVRCFPTATAENQFLAGLPAFPVGPRQESVWERTWARFDALCARRNGRLIDHDTTADVARDMDLLRQAVGDPVLNYVGLSYGSGLGATYANLFPARAGHLILDANLNPAAWTSGDGELPASLRLGQDQASAASMRAFLDLCGTAPTTGCAFSAGTPAATRAKFAALLSRLRRHPVTIGTPPQAYTYADTVTAVPLGTVSQWQAGASLLQQLWAASASPAARAQTTALSGPAAASPAVYAGQEQAFAVSCADGPNPRDPRAYAAATRLAYARSGGLGSYWTWLEEPCAAWPAGASQDRYTGPWNRPTASPILLLGNTGDPVLPYQDSVAMSRDLARARLLTVDGYGHTEAANPSTCATDYETRYLLTGALPPAATICKQNATPFPPPSR